MNNSSRIYPVLVPLAFVLGLLAGYFTWGREASAGTEAAATRAPQTTQAQQGGSQPAEAQQVVRYQVPEDDDPVLGPDDAPITIIEFSDYECPYCRRWHTEVFEPLVKTFPGQLRFVYRDFPLTSIHPNAVPAAEAANCAHEQGKFWEFNQKLYNGSYGLSTAAYKRYADELGLDAGPFDECINSGRYQDEVLGDLSWASNFGVRSTPTFFINGIAIVGAQPYDVFVEVIQKELAGEIP